MKYGILIFKKENFVMIKYYQEMNGMLENYVHKNTLDILTDNMSEALIVDRDDIPTDIVQIYSTVTLSSTCGWHETLQLVPPYEENIKNDKISVISTLGASVVGLSEGDTIRYGLTGNVLLLKIEKVVQSRTQIELNISE